MLKKCCVLLCALLTLGQTKAQDFKYLVFEAEQESETVSLDDLRKLTFLDGKVQIHTKEENRQMELTALNRIYFSDVTAINTAQSDGYAVTGRNGQWCFSACESDTPAAVYNLTGMLVKQFVVPAGGMLFDTDPLPRGIYLITFGTNTFKLMK